MSAFEMIVSYQVDSDRQFAVTHGMPAGYRQRLHWGERRESPPYAQRIHLRKKARGLSNLPNNESPSKHEDPDVHLMLRVQQDDPAAYEQLIQTYQVRLIRILQHLVGSEASAEDLAQDVFLRVWRARKGYQPTARFATWLFHIAHNVASNAIRDRKRRKEYQVANADPNQSAVLSIEQMAVASTGAMPMRKLDKVERADMVRLAVESLNDRQREALLLSKFEGLCYQEIAEAMELSVQAVKSLLSRARVNLKVLLEPYLDHGQLPGTSVEPPSDKE
jgi:RNA polymerase sigma-70 factor (ECF subfamily)